MKSDSIVLVGNGPSVLDHTMGRLIDTYPYVARYNNFVIDKFIDNVGTKTTHWFTTDVFLPIQEKYDIENIYYVTLPRLDYGEKFHSFRSYCLEKNKLKVKPFSESAFWYIRKEYKYENSSTGLASIVWAAQTFKNVFIYGFDCFQAEKHHYGDNNVDCYHIKEKERFVLNELKKRLGNIHELTESTN